MDVSFGSLADGALARTFCRFCSIGRVRSCVRPVCAADVAAGPNGIDISAPMADAYFKLGRLSVMAGRGRGT